MAVLDIPRDSMTGSVVPTTCRRILLFGAYANGNIGDQCQAESLAWHFRRHAPSLQLFAAANNSADRPYAFNPTFTLENGRAIGDADVVNGFSALVIGGGGLLASVHRPLNSISWLEKIRIPIVLLAVGASEEVAEACRSLVERAAFVTARDACSVDILSKYRNDVTLLNDPILADPRLDIAEETVTGGRLCVIPRKQTDKNKPVYEALRALLLPGDQVVSLFPATDRSSGALASFGDADVREVTTMEALISAVDASALIVSERYHGCIMALKRGRPCLGLINAWKNRDSKIGELYHQLGHEHLLHSYRSNPLSRDDIARKLSAEFDGTVLSGALTAIERAFGESFSRLLGRMGVDVGC